MPRRAALSATAELGPAFTRMWAAQGISLLGARVTILALPLCAITLLHASATQMGLLVAAEGLPVLLFGLPAGAWVDRLPRRPILVATSLARAAVLLLVPLAAALGHLSLPLLYAVALAIGALSLTADVAVYALLPALVPRTSLVPANSRLAVGEAVTQVVGPALAGGLIQLVTAPTAIVADAATYLGAAGLLRSMAVPEAPPRPAYRSSLGQDVRQGLASLLASPVLRPLAGAGATFNFFDSLLLAVYLLYMTHTLHLTAGGVGLVFAVGGSGGVLGGLVAAPTARRWGVGTVLTVAVMAGAIAEAAIATAGGPVPLAAAILMAAEVGVEISGTVWRVNAASLRQAATSDHLQGRVNAAMRVLSSGAAPLGALAGGLLGSSLGLRQTVVVAGVGTLFSGAWLVFSPVRQVRTLPMGEPAGEPAS